MLPKTLILVVFGVVGTLAVHVDRECVLKTVEWSGAPCEWPCAATKAVYTKSGKYISKNEIGTRVQIYKDEAIVAFPRYKPGVAVTLGRISLRQEDCEATIVPFPCWSAQDEHSDDGLVSVVDIFVDAHELVWVLDSGVVNTMTDNPLRYAKPKVVCYSLKTGKLVKTLDLSGLVVQASRLQYLVVEYSQCGKPYVYVSDAATKSILVFDVVANKGYRVLLPNAVLATPCRRDILYIALVQRACGNNFLVFTYLASNHIFSIRTDYLRSGSMAGRVVDLGVKPEKLVILGTDLGSAIFFRYEGQPEVYRWDSDTAFAAENFVIVYKSNECLLSTSVCADLRRNRIRVLESNFPDYIENTVGCGAVQQINVIGGCT